MLTFLALNLALKAAWSKILVNKDCVLNNIIDSYLGRFQIDINYILSLSETKSLQLLNIFRYFTRKFYVALMSVNNKSTRKTIKSQLIWNNNLFKYNNKTIGFTNQVQCGILYVKVLFKDNGQFKTLQDFSDVLRINRTGYANIKY